MVKYRLPSSSACVFRCQIVQAFMVSLFSVLGHALAIRSFQVAGEAIVFEQSTFFQGAVAALDLAVVFG